MKNIVYVLAVVLVTGCATMDDLHPDAGGTVFHVRGKTYDEIWRAVTLTASRQLTIIENNKNTGILKAEKGVGLTTWGEVVGVFVRPAGNGAADYAIQVQSLKRSRMQITGQNWTETIVSGIKGELGQ